MNIPKKLTPDFSVYWSNTSRKGESLVFCDTPELNVDDLINEKLREPVVTLQTPTTSIVVVDMVWSEPTEVTLIADRPSLYLVVAVSPSASIQYGYEGELNHSCRAGSVLFLVPGVKIHGQGNAGSFRTIMCSFENAYAEDTLGPLKDLSANQLLGALSIQNSLMTSIMLRLMKEAQRPGPISDAIVESFGKAILVECAHWLLSDNSTKKERGQLTARHFSIIEGYLAGLSGQLPSVEDLSRACGFSERHFLKLFREQTGCSVSQYIKSVQISKAKSYLLDTDIPLKEIAFRLGYSSPANFSTAFRSVTGLTPGQARKNR